MAGIVRFAPGSLMRYGWSALWGQMSSRSAFGVTWLYNMYSPD